MSTEPKPAATSTLDVKVSSQETDDKVGRKVFIGNLAYTATEEQVREFVKDGGGKLESLELATRWNGRAAGYAFAVWSTASEAENAVQSLDKKSLDDREIHVAIAKPRSNAPKKESRKAGPQGEKNSSQMTAESQDSAADGQAGAGPTAESQGGSKQPRSQRKKRSARRLPAEDHDEQEEGNAEPEQEINGQADGQKKPRAKRNRKPKSKAAKANEDTATATAGRIDDETPLHDRSAGAPEAAASTKKSQPRQPRVQTTSEPSSTLVFVANLPFSVGDEQLGEMFSNLNIEIKSAKVITKPSSRRKGVASAARSKGFGFVETASHEQQTAALQKLQGHKIDHREIVVKVANERESAVENPESLDAPKDDAAQ